MDKQALIAVVEQILMGVDMEVLHHIMIDYDLINLQNKYTKEEMVSIISDEIFSRTNSSFEAIEILKEYNINLEL